MARRERAALCETLDRVGPRAPTLCGSWTTHDLAAHLVLRERHLAAVGIAIHVASGWTAHAQRKVANQPFARLVQQVRGGPPWWSPIALPGVDGVVNTLEYLVHHEDVRRASSPWDERELTADDQSQVWDLLRRRAGLFLRRATTSVKVVWPEHDQFVVGSGDGEPAPGTVALSGEPIELAMYLHGRQSHARVQILGGAADVTVFKELDLAL